MTVREASKLWAQLRQDLKGSFEWLHDDVLPESQWKVRMFYGSADYLSGEFGGRRWEIMCHVSDIGLLPPYSLDISTSYRVSAPGDESKMGVPWFFLGEIPWVRYLPLIRGSIYDFQINEVRTARVWTGARPRKRIISPLRKPVVLVASDSRIQTLLESPSWLRSYARMADFGSTNFWGNPPTAAIFGMGNRAIFRIGLNPNRTFDETQSIVEQLFPLAEDLEHQLGAPSAKHLPIETNADGVPYFICPRCGEKEVGRGILGSPTYLLGMVSEKCRVPIFKPLKGDLTGFPISR